MTSCVAFKCIVYAFFACIVANCFIISGLSVCCLVRFVYMIICLFLFIRLPLPHYFTLKNGEYEKQAMEK